jgi:hypothetical protein
MRRNNAAFAGVVCEVHERTGPSVGDRMADPTTRRKRMMRG